MRSTGYGILGCGVLVLVVIFMASECKSCSSKPDRGTGYSATNTIKEYTQKIDLLNKDHDQKLKAVQKSYEQKIDALTKEHETKVGNAYNKGFSEGKKAMLEEINSQINLEAQNKARQGDWNAVLFAPKD